MSPFDPVTTDPRPVSLRVLDNLLGGVLRLVSGGQSSGFDDNDKHLLDIAERMDLVDMEVGFSEPDTYQLAPLGQALLAKHHGLHHVAVGQHGDHDVTALGHGTRGVDRLRAGPQLRRKRTGRRTIQVVHGDLVARAVQMAHHRRAHHAQADKAH